jgi:opacity protein-like surface antigen
MRVAVAAVAALIASASAEASDFSGTFIGVIASQHIGAKTGVPANVPDRWSQGLFAVGYFPRFLDIDTSGPSGGVVLGHGWQNGRFYFGIEGDISLSDRSSSFSFSHPLAIIRNKVAPGLYAGYTLQSTFQSDWFASARVRLGYAASDVFMLYATAGASAMDAEISLAVNSYYNASATGSSPRFGPIVGVGIDLKITPQINVRAEYLYSWFGDVDITVGGPLHPSLSQGLTYRYDLDQHILRLGLTATLPYSQ